VGVKALLVILRKERPTSGHLSRNPFTVPTKLSRNVDCVVFCNSILLIK